MILFATIYNQIGVIQGISKTPYYLCISRPIYNLMKVYLEQAYPDIYTQSFNMFEGLEVIVFDEAAEDFIDVKGVKFS